MFSLSNNAKPSQASGYCCFFILSEKLVSWVTVLILCMGSLFMVSCEKKAEVRKHDLAPKSESVKQVLKGEEEAEVVAFQHELSEAFGNTDRSFLEKRFNINRLMEIALEGLDLESKEKAEFFRGMKSVGSATKQQLVDSLMNSHMRFMKPVNQTRPALLYRMIMEDDSFTYVELHLEKRRRWEIVDLFFYTNGKQTSQMIRGAAAQMLPRKGGVDDVMVEALNEAKEVGVLANQGESRKAWEKWKTISPKGHSSRVVLAYGYMAAFQLCQADVETNDDYGSELKEVFTLMSKKFPNDPGFAILELAIHDLNEDYDKYRDAISRIKEQVGDDPYLDLQEAYVDLIEEKWDVVIAKAKLALNKEPEIFEAYDILWGAYIGKKDYKGMTDSLRGFVELYEVDKSVFTDEPSYEGYFSSPEGQAWLKE